MAIPTRHALLAGGAMALLGLAFLAVWLWLGARSEAEGVADDLRLPRGDALLPATGAPRQSDAGAKARVQPLAVAESQEAQQDLAAGDFRRITVLSEGGQPVAGARIRALRRGLVDPWLRATALPAEATGLGVTDARGQLDLPPYSEDLVLQARAGKRFSLRRSLKTGSLGPLVLHLGRDPLDLRVTVLDAQGQGQAGERVCVSAVFGVATESLVPWVSAVTDAGGQARLSLPRLPVEAALARAHLNHHDEPWLTQEDFLQGDVSGLCFAVRTDAQPADEGALLLDGKGDDPLEVTLQIPATEAALEVLVQAPERAAAAEELWLSVSAQRVHTATPETFDQRELGPRRVQPGETARWPLRSRDQLLVLQVALTDGDQTRRVKQVFKPDEADEDGVFRVRIEAPALCDPLYGVLPEAFRGVRRVRALAVFGTEPRPFFEGSLAELLILSPDEKGRFSVPRRLLARSVEEAPEERALLWLQLTLRLPDGRSFRWRTPRGLDPESGGDLGTADWKELEVLASGRVMDASGKPLAGVEVFGTLKGDVRRTPFARTHSDALGRFVLLAEGPPPPTPWELEALATDPLRAATREGKGRVRGLDLTVLPFRPGFDLDFEGWSRELHAQAAVLLVLPRAAGGGEEQGPLSVEGELVRFTPSGARFRFPLEGEELPEAWPSSAELRLQTKMSFLRPNGQSAGPWALARTSARIDRAAQRVTAPPLRSWARIVALRLMTEPEALVPSGVVVDWQAAGESQVARVAFKANPTPLLLPTGSLRLRAHSDAGYSERTRLDAGQLQAVLPHRHVLAVALAVPKAAEAQAAATGRRVELHLLRLNGAGSEQAHVLRLRRQGKWLRERGVPAARYRVSVVVTQLTTGGTEREELRYGLGEIDLRACRDTITLPLDLEGVPWPALPEDGDR